MKGTRLLGTPDGSNAENELIQEISTMKLSLRSLPSIGEKTLKRSRRRGSSAATGTRMMKRALWTFCVLLLVSPSEAQIGTNICACSPPTYEFTLDFSLSCADAQLPGAGVSEFECIIAPFQTGAGVDLRPASVETVDFVEFDQALGRLEESSISQQFRDGDTLTYTSRTSNPDGLAMPTVPKALQITMLAQNAIGQPLLMTWLVTFTNACDTFPVFTPGDQVGWTRFSVVSEPDSSICPAVEPETGEPTGAPAQGTSHPRPTPYPTRRTPPPFPCRPAGSSKGTPKSRPSPKQPPHPKQPPSQGNGFPSKGIGYGKGANVFRAPTYYTGKGSMKKSKKYHYYKSSKSKKSKKHGKSNKSKKSKKQGYNYYPEYTKGYYQGKGKGVVYKNQDLDDDDYDNLPICPPPRSSKGHGYKSAPHGAPSYKSAHPPSPPTPGAADDDDPPQTDPPTQTPVVFQGPTPTAQQAQENPAGSPTALPPAAPATGPVVAEWGNSNKSDARERGMRAALIVGAGVAAVLIAVIATYIYRREKQYVAKQTMLERTARTPLRPRPILPRRELPVAQTMMSGTESSPSEFTSMARQ